MAIKGFYQGRIVFVKNDGAFMAGHAASFNKEVMPGMAEVIIKGGVYWIQLDRLAVQHGK